MSKQHFQSAFLAAATQGKMDEISQMIASPDAHARLQINIDTIMAQLVQALHLTFPGIWHLLGDECANSVAHYFIQERAHMPTSGCLDDWGGEFPSFIATLPSLESYPYLYDYGCYEWSSHLAMTAKDEPPVVADAFTQLDAETLNNCYFQFRADVQLIKFEYDIAVLADWLTRRASHALDLQRATYYGLIFRHQHHVQVLWLQEENYLFYRQLKQASVEVSINHQLAQERSFDIIAAMAPLISYGLITQITKEQGNASNQ